MASRVLGGDLGWSLISELLRRFLAGSVALDKSEHEPNSVECFRYLKMLQGDTYADVTRVAASSPLFKIMFPFEIVPFEVTVVSDDGKKKISKIPAVKGRSRMCLIANSHTPISFIVVRTKFGTLPVVLRTRSSRSAKF
jgi:hypothetical protein